MKINKQRTQFDAHGLKIATILNIPESAEGKKHPAIICVHPGTSCKDQTSGLYAEKLAERGYVTIAYDASYQGESEGEPHFLEDPAARVEDIRCAVDYLTTLDFVDEDRIGVLGICAGGGYAVNAAMTERRIKAVGTVVPGNFGRSLREGGGDPIKELEAIGRQRTAEARGAKLMINTIIPQSHEEREQAGITDSDTVEAVDYYTTPRGKSPNAQNKMVYSRMDALYAFDAFNLVEELLTQPLQIIVGGKIGSFGSYENGQIIYNRAASKKKDIYILENVSHYDLYDQPESVKKAVEKLDAFYKENL